MMIGSFGLLPASAAAPSLINYQGRLRDDSGVAITAATTVQFSIYNHATNGATTDAASEAGALLWKETYSDGAGSCAQVDPDTDGYFTVQLGNCTAFPSYLDFTQSTLYIGVKVGSDSEATPRTRLAAHPYSLNTNRIGDFIDTGSSSLRGETLGTATVGVQGYNSPQVLLQGSGWTGAAAANREIKLQNVVTSSSSYRFALSNNDDTELFTVTSSGNAGINDTSPDYTLEVGVASGDSTLALSDPDIVHGMTDAVNTDVYAYLNPNSSTAGGLSLAGLSDTDAIGLALNGIIGSADPTDTVAAIVVSGSKKSGTATQALGDAETVFEVANAGSPLLRILGNGNLGLGDATPTATKLSVKSTQTSGNITAVAAPSAVTLAGALTGFAIDLSTNYTATGYGVTGASVALPAVTNTGAGTYAYKGLAVTSGALIQNTGAGTDTWSGLDITMPNITQTTGSVISTGVKITGGTVTSGTSYALTIDANAGNVGIGTATPFSIASLDVERSATDSHSVNVKFGGTNTINTGGSYNIYGVYSTPDISIGAGQTDSGDFAGGYFAGTRLQADSGTLTDLLGLDVAYGNALNTSGTTTNAYGLRIVPYHSVGTINNSYGVYIDNANTGGTVGSYYGIYQKDTTVTGNYFGGKVGIGDTTPDYSLEISAASGDSSLALSDPDVAHGITDIAQTDIYMYSRALSSTAGGLDFAGISDTDAIGASLAGVIGSADPTDSTSALMLSGIKKAAAGTGYQALGAAETVLQVYNNTTAVATMLGSGYFGLGDTTPDYTLEVGAASGDATFGLSDPDVAHGMTDAAQTDAYAFFYPNGSTAGGLGVAGLSDTDAVGLSLNGVIGSIDPTDTVAAVTIVSAKKNGTTTQALGAAETTFQVYNFGTPLMTVLGNGYFGIGDVSPDYNLEVGTSSGDTKFVLSDPDVAHGMTDFFQTDVYAGMYATSSTTGGLTLAGLSDTDANAMKIAGVVGSIDPTDTTAAILLQGVKKNGTSVTSLAAAETVLRVDNGSTNLFSILGDGTTQFVNNITDYVAVNEASPTISLGSSATERFNVQTVYNTGGQAVSRVRFDSYTASVAVDAGEFWFVPDEQVVLSINDSGIRFFPTADRIISFDSVIADNTNGKNLTISASVAGNKTSAGDGLKGGSLVRNSGAGSAGYQAGDDGGAGGDITDTLASGGASGGGGMDVAGAQGVYKLQGAQSEVKSYLYNTATAVDGEDIGSLLFSGKNSAAGMIDYAFITAVSDVTTAGSEVGGLDLGVYIDAAGETVSLLSLQVVNATPETFVYIGAVGGIQNSLIFNGPKEDADGAISYILGQKAGTSTASGGYASGALVLATQDGSAAVSGVTNGGNGESVYIYPGAGGAGFGGGTVGATGNIFLAYDNLATAAQGNVAIGTADLDGTPAIGRLVVRGSTNDGSTNIFVGRDSDGVNMATIDTNGNLVMTASARFAAIGSGASAGALHYTADGTLTTNTSDVRLKENIVDLSNSLDKVLKLRSVNFTWKSDPGLGMRVGFIAQEMEQIFPELVFTNPVDGFMGIDYESLVPILTKAIQEQQVQIDALKLNQNSGVTLSSDLTSNGALELISQLAFGVDTVGQAIIQTNDDRVTITFEQPYGYLPIVTATPIGLFGGQYAIENVTFAGFDIVVKDPVMTDSTFGWHAFGAKQGKVYSSDGSVTDIELPEEVVAVPVYSGGAAVSSAAPVEEETASAEEPTAVAEEPAAPAEVEVVAPVEEPTEETVVEPADESTEPAVTVVESAPAEESAATTESTPPAETTTETAPAADSSTPAADAV